jgi:hypothetical protein
VTYTPSNISYSLITFTSPGNWHIMNASLHVLHLLDKETWEKRKFEIIISFKCKNNKEYLTKFYSCL